jgi:hypothetical protein
MFKIAIPTYNRYDNFKTIDFLKNNNMPNECITIFVASEDQKEKYINSIGNNYKFVVGVLGICNQRNFITDYYDENEIIISMDDDIINLKHKDDKPMIDWLNDCINYLIEFQLGLLTIGPSSNPFFFENKNKSISFKNGNYLGVGVFHIYRNHKNFKMTIDVVEDYDRSIMYLKHYGSNVRYYDVLLETKYWGKGGLETQRTKEYYLSNINKLIYKYPEYLTFNYKLIRQVDKYNKIPNLKLLKEIKINEVIELPSIPANEFCILYSMFEEIYIPRKKGRTNRRGFPENHQSTTFGYVRARFGTRKNGKLFDLSLYSIKYPEIYEELLRIGNIYCPFKFTSIHINKNVVCPKHIDSKNVAQSMLVSFGDYTGCKIVVNGIEYDTNCNPIIFDGSNIEHCNTDDLEGTKYSLIFFNGELSNNEFIDK